MTLILYDESHVLHFCRRGIRPVFWGHRYVRSRPRLRHDNVCINCEEGMYQNATSHQLQWCIEQCGCNLVHRPSRHAKQRPFYTKCRGLTIRKMCTSTCGTVFVRCTSRRRISLNSQKKNETTPAQNTCLCFNCSFKKSLLPN